ncbi:DUF1508 domain-containing protein [Taibaiella koreensis]
MSEMCKSKVSRDNGIESVKKCT